VTKIPKTAGIGVSLRPTPSIIRFFQLAGSSIPLECCLDFIPPSLAAQRRLNRPAWACV
jgi:hypothetical protein